ncbi:putative disease resistance protein RGA3 [Carex rostrata]
MVMILDAFLPKFNELLMQMAQDEVGMLLDIPGQIEKLNKTVCDIQCVLADAERKKSKGSAIERWLMQLKDVMYDADDVIDLCQMKVKERLAASSSHSSTNARYGCHLLSCFRNPLFAHEIGYKIKDINSRLQEIAKSKATLGLTESPLFYGPFVPGNRVDSMISRKTDPAVVQADIVGEQIEQDTELLVNWLIEEEKDVRENIVVAAIVGMGGIGKTTLAKRIFNDKRIGEAFQLKIWVCISKEVKGVEVLKCMIREAGGEHGAAQERSELVPILVRTIQKKKFLLVLDDVWEESRKVWDDLLRAPMNGAAHGSRLLVTTRDERVANGIRVARSHRVDKLSDVDGWSLLIKQVAPNGIESEIQDFKEIGMQIVEKCDGLPLAIKSIGGVLRTKGNTRDNWEAILRSNVWSMDGLSGDIHRAFYLSYEDLQAPLKQCFIFCSLFPEDCEIVKPDLIYMWLAEGFLHDKGDIWELGDSYYKELIMRNLLESLPGYKSSCKMHDLLWSFAHQLGKDENYVLGKGQVLSKSDGSLKVRRLSIEASEVNIEVIKKEIGLRTLVHREKSDFTLGDLCKTVCNLRIINLCNTGISSLPDSLFGLVHLRYLDVSASKLRSIPSSIENLRNLACLWCTNCTELSQVPESICNLRELRCLGFEITKVEAIPTGINNLEKLNVLHGFKPYKNNLERFSSLDGLESLSKLIQLRLEGLERVCDRNIAKKANLRSKNHLKQLYLYYTLLSPIEQLSQTNEKKMVIEDVLNELCPPSSLEEFSIECYFGRCLPNWLNLGAALPNLNYLVIHNCVCLEELAPLGQLPNLVFLRIKGVYSVVSVGEEFLGRDIQSEDVIAMSCPIKPAFPKLSELEFLGLPKWKEWWWNMGQPAMTKLKNLVIEDCPQLRSLPEGLSHHAISLESLQINGAQNLIFVEKLPSIKEIRVSNNLILERFSNLPSISHILIKKCPNLQTLEDLKALQSMVLIDFEMETLPDYLATITLQKLTVGCSEELLLKIARERGSGSEWSIFKHIPNVTIYSPNESLYVTYKKTPCSFTTNASTRLRRKETLYSGDWCSMRQEANSRGCITLEFRKSHSSDLIET